MTSKTDKDLDRHFKKFLYEIASDILVEIIKTAPVKTGNLRRDVKIYDDDTSNYKTKIANSKLVPYARFVHQGTKAYTIKPKRKKALKTPYGLKRSVNHPGIKANPYFNTALSKYLRSPKFNNQAKKLTLDITNRFTSKVRNSLENVEIIIYD